MKLELAPGGAAHRDGRTGDAFSVEVRDGERALDVFHHPYAYAATRRAPLVALAA